MSITLNTERWNTMDSVFMALGVRKAIYDVVGGRSVSTEYEESLTRGIEFLNEAKAGKAIIQGLGTEATASFNGTFSPFKLTADVILHVAKEQNIDMQIADFDQRLDRQRETLEVIRADETSRFASLPIHEVELFFEELCELLLQQLDPTTKKYSQPSKAAWE